MTNNNNDATLVQRLQILRVEHRLTIAEMAEKCGIPKSSLESYMRLEGARKPGFDALIVIASAFSVSIDWLVGLSESRRTQDENAYHFEIACMAVVDSLLSRLEAEQAKSTIPIIKDGTFAGVQRIEVATRAMLSLKHTAKLMQTASQPGMVLDQTHIDALRNSALEKPN